MKPGPLRQLTGALGLIGLTPTALLLGQGAVSAGEAALRSLVTLVAVVAVGRLAAWWLTTTATAFESRSQAPADAPTGRRQTDGRNEEVRDDDPRTAGVASQPAGNSR